MSNFVENVSGKCEHLLLASQGLILLCKNSVFIFGAARNAKIKAIIHPAQIKVSVMNYSLLL